MTHQVMTRAGVPEPRVRDRRAFVPRAPLNDEAGGLRTYMQLLGDLFRRLAGRYLVLGVGPGNVTEKPAAGPLGLEGLTGDSSHRVGVDETFLELERLLVAKMDTPNRQHRCTRRHAEQRTVIGIMSELAALEQAILIGAAAARDDVRDVPDFEDRTLERTLRDDSTDPSSALNEALAGEALNSTPHCHARSTEASCQCGFCWNARARWPRSAHDRVCERASNLLPDGTLAVERGSSRAAGNSPCRGSVRRCFSVRRATSQRSLLNASRHVRSISGSMLGHDCRALPARLIFKVFYASDLECAFAGFAYTILG